MALAELKVCFSDITERWHVYFEGGLSGWNQLDDGGFDTEAEAQAFADYQIDNADYSFDDEDVE
jgi:hypothetical protein